MNRLIPQRIMPRRNIPIRAGSQAQRDTVTFQDKAKERAEEQRYLAYLKDNVNQFSAQGFGTIQELETGLNNFYNENVGSVNTKFQNTFRGYVNDAISRSKQEQNARIQRLQQQMAEYERDRYNYMRDKQKSTGSERRYYEGMQQGASKKKQEAYKLMQRLAKGEILDSKGVESYLNKIGIQKATQVRQILTAKEQYTQVKTQNKAIQEYVETKAKLNETQPVEYIQKKLGVSPKEAEEIKRVTDENLRLRDKSIKEIAEQVKQGVKFSESQLKETGLRADEIRGLKSLEEKFNRQTEELISKVDKGIGGYVIPSSQRATIENYRAIKKARDELQKSISNGDMERIVSNIRSEYVKQSLPIGTRMYDTPELKKLRTEFPKLEKINLNRITQLSKLSNTQIQQIIKNQNYVGVSTMIEELNRLARVNENINPYKEKKGKEFTKNLIEYYEFLVKVRQKKLEARFTPLARKIGLAKGWEEEDLKKLKKRLEDKDYLSYEEQNQWRNRIKETRKATRNLGSFLISSGVEGIKQTKDSLDLTVKAGYGTWKFLRTPLIDSINAFEYLLKGMPKSEKIKLYTDTKRNFLSVWKVFKTGFRVVTDATLPYFVLRHPTEVALATALIIDTGVKLKRTTIERPEQIMGFLLANWIIGKGSEVLAKPWAMLGETEKYMVTRAESIRLFGTNKKLRMDMKTYTDIVDTLPKNVMKRLEGYIRGRLYYTERGELAMKFYIYTKNGRRISTTKRLLLGSKSLVPISKADKTYQAMNQIIKQRAVDFTVKGRIDLKAKTLEILSEGKIGALTDSEWNFIKNFLDRKVALKYAGEKEYVSGYKGIKIKEDKKLEYQLKLLEDKGIIRKETSKIRGIGGTYYDTVDEIGLRKYKISEDLKMLLKTGTTRSRLTKIHELTHAKISRILNNRKNPLRQELLEVFQINPRIIFEKYSPLIKKREFYDYFTFASKYKQADQIEEIIVRARGIPELYNSKTALGELLRKIDRINIFGLKINVGKYVPIPKSLSETYVKRQKTVFRKIQEMIADMKRSETPKKIIINSKDTFYLTEIKKSFNVIETKKLNNVRMELKIINRLDKGLVDDDSVLFAKFIPAKLKKKGVSEVLDNADEIKRLIFRKAKIKQEAVTFKRLLDKAKRMKLLPEEKKLLLSNRWSFIKINTYTDDVGRTVYEIPDIYSAYNTAVGKQVFKNKAEPIIPLPDKTPKPVRPSTFFKEVKQADGTVLLMEMKPTEKIRATVTQKILNKAKISKSEAIAKAEARSGVKFTAQERASIHTRRQLKQAVEFKLRLRILKDPIIAVKFLKQTTSLIGQTVFSLSAIAKLSQLSRGQVSAQARARLNAQAQLLHQKKAVLQNQAKMIQYAMKDAVVNARKLQPAQARAVLLKFNQAHIQVFAQPYPYITEQTLVRLQVPTLPRITTKQSPSMKKIWFEWGKTLPKRLTRLVNGLVKTRGKIKEIKLRTTPKRALKYMARVIDNTTARSFQLKIVGWTRQSDIVLPQNYMYKFRMKKSRNPMVLNIVEKSRYAIDTEGEKRGLS